MANEEMKKIFSANLRRWLVNKNKTQADLYRYLRVSSATVSDWCNAKTMPRTDKIQAIAIWLGIELSDLLEEKETNDYYLNKKTRKIAQEVYDNPELQILFDASRDLEPKDVEFVVEMINRMKKGDD